VNPSSRFALSRASVFRALRHREFRLLFVAFVINQTGFWISHISMQGLMAELTASDPLRLGLFFFALYSPAFFLAPVAGVVADRLDRKAIMMVCNVVLAAIMTVLVVLSTTGIVTASLLLLLGATMGSTFAFAGPAGSAVSANAVVPEDLSSAVSLQSAANNLTRVVAPALAAPLVATGHYPVAFVVFGAASLVSGFLLLRIRLSPYESDPGDEGMLTRLAAGLRHAREKRPAVPALLTVSVLAVFGVSHVAMLPTFATTILGGRELFPWLVAGTGVGAMFGAIATAGEKHPSLRRAALRLAAYGIALLVFSQSDRLWIAFAAEVAIGYFYFSVMTGLQTLLQQIVDESKRGRIMSLFHVAWAGLSPFGALAMGAIARPVGVPQTLAAAALICFSFGVLLAARTRA
jgi:predicted MFS family arabinose efflux permease